MNTPTKSLPPCPCGQPAIKRESNVSCCARCHKIETSMNNVRNRDFAGNRTSGLEPYTMFDANSKTNIPRYE